MTGKRNSGLDVMRSLAICLVIVAHFTGRVEVLGWIGVELFFVLSGFLVGGIFIRKVGSLESPTFAHIANFWKRRWWRTVPNYLLFILIVALVEHAVGLGDWTRFWMYPLFLQNLAWPKPPFFGVSWSLCVEEWFYLSLPLVFLAIRSIKALRVNAVPLTIGLITAASIILRFTVGQQFATNDLRQIVVYRLDALMIGVAIAYFADRGWFDLSKLRFAAIPGFAIIVLLVALFKNDEFSGIPAGVSLTLLPLGCGLTLPWFSMLAISGPFRSVTGWVSAISYSLYLSHSVFLLPAARMFVEGDGIHPLTIVVKLVAVALAFVASHFIYKWFEIPMMNRRPAELSV